jgi:hypothetical protein
MALAQGFAIRLWRDDYQCIWYWQLTRNGRVKKEGKANMPHLAFSAALTAHVAAEIMT